MLLVSLLLCLALGLSQECTVKSNGFKEVCKNGEVCVSTGCRCLQNATSCFHAPSPKCMKQHTCALLDGTEQCCRFGESCTSVGCRCGANACAPPPCVGDCQKESPMPMTNECMKDKIDRRFQCFISGECVRLRSESMAATPCVDGYAGEYPCKNVDLLSFVDFEDMGCDGAEGNDIWGWTSPDGRDVAIMGCTTGAAFVEITDPLNPVPLGFMPSTLGNSAIWRDMKVWDDYVFVVSECRGNGMQILKLSHLFETDPYPGKQFAPDVLYSDQMGDPLRQLSTHNIHIDNGIAFLVGCQTCMGGLLMVDVRDPLNPQYAGCFSADGYTHDVQCVIYVGLDHRFLNRHLCFASNEDSLTIVDVTDPAKAIMLSRVTYNTSRYTHQGWLTRDQKYFLVDDELDEMYETYDDTGRTVTYVFDVEDITVPKLVATFQSPVAAVDHNQYILDDFVYQANYASGLRIWSGMLGEMNSPSWKPNLVGYFDVHPEADVADFYGSWSVYPFFTTKNNINTLIVSSIERGLFILKWDKAAIYN